MKLKLKIACITFICLHLTIKVDAQEEVNDKERLSPGDPSSYSRPDLAVVKHYEIRLAADFNRKIFSGNVMLTVTKEKKFAHELILDTQDLQISHIRDNLTGILLNYAISEPSAIFGSKLTIKLPTTAQRSSEYTITIAYNTSSYATGLQWLDPKQTAGKKDLFVYTHFQPIGARGFLPCQDTPSVKATYYAEITCPKHLKAVMSATPIQTRERKLTNTYHFLQRVKVPSYLIALAIGRLSSKRLGPRSTVYAEEQYIQPAVSELANIEKMLKTAEKLCGSYGWGNYDVLIMPPSFPNEGMENPSISFLTPRMLTGDKSMNELLAHEMAHSWSGNSVTSANVEHLWLNEGVTMFLERRILGKMDGRRVEDFEACRGLYKLRENVEEMNDHLNMTKLVPDLTGIHPDDYITLIPYEKGYIFVRYLETLVGGPKVFEPFLRAYMKNFKGKSIVTNDFRKYLENYFSTMEEIQTIDWDAWMYDTGMPSYIPDYDQTIMNKVQAMKTDVLTWAASTDNSTFPINEYSVKPKEKQQLIQEVIQNGPVAVDKLEQWGKAWNLFDKKNSETLFLWLQLGLKSKWDEAVLPAIGFLSTYGSITPQVQLFKEMYDWKDVRPLAIQLYKLIEGQLMDLVRNPVEKILKLNQMD